MSDELLRSLSELGADYEPDVTAIEQRIQGHRPPIRPVPHRATAPVRYGRLVLLPAAAVLLVVGGIVLVTSTNGPGRDPARDTVLPIATAPAAGNPTPTSGTSTPTATATRHVIGPAVSATRHPAATTRPTPRAGAAKAKVDVRAVPASAGAPVQLASPPLLDWLAVGTRADLKQVRAKTGASAALITVAQPEGARSTGGSFRISWTDGLPEQDHVGATSWLEADGRAGLSVQVAASSRPRTVVLYAGAEQLRATLTISGSDVASSTISLSPGTGGPAAGSVVITVALPATSGPTRLHLGGAADGSNPEVYLAAVTVAPRT